VDLAIASTQPRTQPRTQASGGRQPAVWWTLQLRSMPKPATGKARFPLFTGSFTMVAILAVTSQEQRRVFSSPLQRAIEKGLRPGSDLSDALDELEDYTITSQKDAEAICEALAQFPLPENPKRRRIVSPLRALVNLFQNVESADVPAFEVLYHQGQSELIRIFESLVESHADDDHEDLLFTLKILAMYGSPEGTEKVIEAARLPVKPEAYMWHVILAQYGDGHACREHLFQSLSDPLPTDFLAIALLDAANQSCIRNELELHPFDSEQGMQVLRRWLEDHHPDHASYAHSATAAIPFLDPNDQRKELLGLAMSHQDIDVRIEASWAAAKLGDDEGLHQLQAYCLDLRHSDVAKGYLNELGYEDQIPEQATEPSFVAQATFAQWLAHPNELGCPPDEMKVVDHRLLAWPPESAEIPVWIIRYRLRDRHGLEADNVDSGMVGSVTWCFFSYQMHLRPPEDVYAIHCYWEMEHADLIHETEVDDPSEYVGLLKQWRGEPVESALVKRVAEVSPKLRGVSQFVALAEASRGGQPGWIVLDGPQTRWYPASEQPSDSPEGAALKIHIGRQLLALPLDQPRGPFLTQTVEQPSTESFRETYARLFDEAMVPGALSLNDMLGRRGPLMRHFDRYLSVVADGDQDARQNLLITQYQRILTALDHADEPTEQDLLDSFGILGEYFEPYVDAIAARGQSDSIVEILGRVQRLWQHNLGYIQMAMAAMKANRHDLAEPLLKQLLADMEHYYRGDSMGYLAEIWAARGENEKAIHLLLDCMQRLREDIAQCTDPTDRKSFTDQWGAHRQTFLRLFPEASDRLQSL
jgi:hypothetical protein